MAVVRRLIAAEITPMFAYTAAEFHGGSASQYVVRCTQLSVYISYLVVLFYRHFI